MALAEYNSEEKAIHPGGINNRPFWNTYSTRFTFCPKLCFPYFPCTKEYIFTATDSTGATYSFSSNSSQAFLTPIWSKLATGTVTLKVEALTRTDQAKYLIGARTFFKCAPFLGKENYADKARSYKECASMAFGYAFDEPMIQYWAKYGKPDPDYYHNVYPSKTISSIIRAMVHCAKVQPEKAEEAYKIAVSAADYLLSLTYENDEMKGLPPTFSFKGLNEEKILATAPAAKEFKDTNMLIYPATVGSAYLLLFDAIGDEKYFTAAKRIADYYKKHILPCGSWYLKVSATTGEPVVNNKCVTFSILDFIHDIAARCNDDELKTIEKRYFEFISETCLKNYNWDGQFEDIHPQPLYYNLTHIEADNMIQYIKNNLSDDPKWVAIAEELMRFVEDQFVVWEQHEPWRLSKNGSYKYFENYYRFAPTGEEQYFCYEPIDGSTAKIMGAFLDIYQMTKSHLALEKALVLADMITRMQNASTGVIPTFWVKEDCMDELDNFWINCHLATAAQMLKLSEFIEK